MAQHDRSGLDAQRPQRQPGTEGDVIHHDAVGLHLVHDLGQPVEHPVGFVEQVVAASVRLMEQRRDRTDPGRLEERAQVLVLAGGCWSTSMIPALLPLPRRSEIHGSPACSTIGRVDSPVATTASPPVRVHAVATWIMGPACDA